LSSSRQQETIIDLHVKKKVRYKGIAVLNQKKKEGDGEINE